MTSGSGVSPCGPIYVLRSRRVGGPRAGAKTAAGYNNIHTNYDTPSMIDPTKLKRSAFIGAASAYVIANLDSNDVSRLIALQKRQVLKRSAALLSYCELLPLDEQDNAKHYFWAYEMAAFNSIKSFASVFEGKAAATFVVLAGVGIALMTNSAIKENNQLKLKTAKIRIIKRALFLFIIGVSYIPIWPADILHFYGIYMVF